MRILILALLFIAGPSFAVTCKISEYAQIIRDGDNHVTQTAREPAVNTQNVSFTSDTDSSPFNANTAFVRIVCDAKAHFVFGTGTITATANSPYLAPDVAEYFGVIQGSAIKVSFYDGSS